MVIRTVTGQKVRISKRYEKIIPQLKRKYNSVGYSLHLKHHPYDYNKVYLDFVGYGKSVRQFPILEVL